MVGQSLSHEGDEYTYMNSKGVGSLQHQYIIVSHRLSHTQSTVYSMILAWLCSFLHYDRTVDSSASTVHCCHFNGVVSGMCQSRDDGLYGSTS